MELKKGFEPRLKSLQRLCSNTDGQYPSGLLFVPGPDGKNNKGSLTVLKYLFQGAVNRELLDGLIDDKLECLEEVVLLIQETSISIVYTSEMKACLAPWFSSCPMLVEYLPSVEEEKDMDALQERKVIDFKRMILEAVPTGASVGIPIPLGYESTKDVEVWPLLQAFALDENVCSTGFFTQMYDVVDITEFLDIIYCTLDVPHVDYALRTLHQSVIPHMEQSEAIMDTQSAEQRARLTMEEMLGPLDMLFEYGELQASGPVDPVLRPIVLVGQDTLLLGSCPRSGLPASWIQSKVSPRNLHYVLEACEPSSGLRWCRTYLLQRGRRLPTVKDASALVQNADEDEETNESRAALSIAAAAVARIEALNSKLTASLRAAVRRAFSEFTDVLEAGQYVQQTVDACMSGKSSLVDSQMQGLGLESVVLRADEYLQVHMDCMNGHGKVVSIDDIDDMGGTCWTYIRVSAHRIQTGPDSLGVVAVGDTFLFSSPAETGKPSKKSNTSVSRRFPENTCFSTLDAYCITDLVPYYRHFVGSGVEGRSSKKLLSWLKSSDMVSAIGLGRSLQHSLGRDGQIFHIPVLTDHPLVPFADGTMRGFTGGFVLEKMNTICLPLILSVEVHAECVWTVNLDDCLTEAKRRFGISDDENLVDDAGNEADTTLSTEPGVIIVFKLKSFAPKAVAERADKRRKHEELENDAIQKELSDRKAKFDAGFNDTLEVYSEQPGITSVFNMGAADVPVAAHIESNSAFARNELRKQEEVARRQTKEALEYNPLERSLPFLPAAEPRYIAFCAHTEARSTPAVSNALKHWRDALRMHDVAEYRGISESTPLPTEILQSFISYLDNKLIKLRGQQSLHDHTDFVIPAETALAHTESAKARSGLQPGYGYLPMRCLHALNETSRLMAAKPREDEEDEEEKKDTKSHDSFEEEEEPEAAPNPLKLVVVTGHPGACSLTIGAQIAERTGKLLLSDEREADPNTEATSTSLCVAMYVDLSQLGNKGCETVEHIVNTAWKECRKNSEVSLHETKAIVVSMVTNPGKHIRLAEVLSVLSYVCSRNYSTISSDSRSVINRGCVVASIVSTMCPDAIMIRSRVGDENSSNHEAQTPSPVPVLGPEAWNASGFDAAHTGQLADLVVAIDGSSSGSSFSELRHRLQQFNKLAVVIRVTPSNLRVDGDVIEHIIDQLRAAKLVPGSVVAKPLCVSKGYGVPLPTTATEREWAVSSKLRTSLSLNAEVPRLQAMDIAPPSADSSCWSINSLISLLKLLFPRAVISNNVACDTWKVPAVTEDPLFQGLTGLRLASALAKVKVMTKRQCEEEKERFKKELESLLFAWNGNASKETGLESHVKSVHGVVAVPVGNPIDEDGRGAATVGAGLAVVEACSGSIVVRYIDNATHCSLLSSSAATSVLKGKPSNHLYAFGVLGSKQHHLLRDLFKLCGRHRLSAQKPIERSDLSKHELFSIQRDMEAKETPLPSGWWWNGTSYVDHAGTSLLVRPDVEPHAKLYIMRKNKKIDEYNEMLGALQRLL